MQTLEAVVQKQNKYLQLKLLIIPQQVPRTGRRNRGPNIWVRKKSNILLLTRRGRLPCTKSDHANDEIIIPIY